MNKTQLGRSFPLLAVPGRGRFGVYIPLRPVYTKKTAEDSAAHIFYV
jgi:hypothetical protein